jgi:ribosomal protein L14
MSDMNASLLVHLLIVNAYTAYLCTIGSRAPRVQKLGERMEHPIIGDIVLEVSKLAAQPELDRIGELVMADVSEKRYTIHTFDGRLVTWTDAAFIAVVRRDTSDEHTFFPQHVAF